MASLSKTYNQQKLFGQVYTPISIVEKILDDIGYNFPSILGKNILDPACGDGRFLEQVVKRIVTFSPPEYLVHNLSFVHGWDIDPEAVNGCISNLNQIVEPYHIQIDWQIKVIDALTKIHTDDKFEFIVGNPPYIRIQHLEKTQREFIQQNFSFCKSGSTDIYIAFYELSLHLLTSAGKCGFITPNTFFYTETAQLLRQALTKGKHIYQLTNYGNIQLFGNATTYSAITVIGHQPQEQFLLQEATTEQDFTEKRISTSSLEKQRFWQLSTHKIIDEAGVRLGDICRIHVGITTLADKAYIFKIVYTDHNLTIVESRLRGIIKIESAILKPIIKGSTLKNSQAPITEVVLFPYQKVGNKHQIISEESLQENYPLTYQYLLSVKGELDKRDAGKPNPVAWYAFGRSQGLDTSFGKKIIFSPMNAKPNFVLYENEDCTFYSGYCIKYDGNYEQLLQQLNSERLADFIAISSRDFRGGWKAYNKTTLQEFRVIL